VQALLLALSVTTPRTSAVAEPVPIRLALGWDAFIRYRCRHEEEKFQPLWARPSLSGESTNLGWTPEKKHGGQEKRCRCARHEVLALPASGSKLRGGESLRSAGEGEG
jgi:hypothetical protein